MSYRRPGMAEEERAYGGRAGNPDGRDGSEGD